MENLAQSAVRPLRRYIYKDTVIIVITL
jgi:hypothetical protein